MNGARTTAGSGRPAGPARPSGRAWTRGDGRRAVTDEEPVADPAEPVAGGGAVRAELLQVPLLLVEDEGQVGAEPPGRRVVEEVRRVARAHLEGHPRPELAPRGTVQRPVQRVQA